MPSDDATASTPEPPVIPYRTARTGSRFSRGLKARLIVMTTFSVIVAGVLIIHPLLEISSLQYWLGGGALGTPFAPIAGGDREVVLQNYLFPAVGYFLLFLITQWAFLMPRGKWRLTTIGETRPSRLAAWSAAFIGTLLSVGLIATVMDFAGWWLSLTTGAVEVDGFDSNHHAQTFLWLWPIILCIWCFWAVVFGSYFRSVERYTGLTRVIRWLIGGTILEMVIAVPAFASTVKQDECYCQRGTYTGVAFGATAILWFFGPGAFLLYWREKRRLERIA
jgi:hypothetical protein